MKKLIIFIMSAVMAVSLTACGSDTQESSLPEESLVSQEESSAEPEPEPVNVQEVIDQVYNELLDGENSSWLREATDEELEKVFGLTEDLCAQVFVRHTMLITQATRLIGVEAREGQLQAVTDALTATRDEVAAYFQNNNEAQYEITQNARIFTNGNYVFLLMCENAEQAEEIVSSFFVE
ncbi:MAG TPA: DUF4358 domain-containing protein [Firmicutes bacterium]|nr:DUF4358 domain-containing protein [Bacillota bacterium]